MCSRRRARIGTLGRRVLVGLGVVVVAGSLLAAVAVRIVFPVPRFPDPTGPYAIGTRTYHWVDAARPEPFTGDPTDRRELVAQLWYPAAGTAGAAAMPYLDHPQLLDPWAARWHVPPILLGNIRGAPTHAVADARPASGRFPVLVHLTGLGGYRNASLFWIEELVSHGYVVVGLDQPGTAVSTVFPDGRVVPMVGDKAAFDRYMPLALSSAEDQAPVMNAVPLPGGVVPFLAEDARFTLSQAAALDRDDPVLAGHLDTARSGVFGMSLGGYTGPEACRVDSRFRACLAVDSGQTAPVARNGVDQPVMVMSRDASVMREERSQAGGWPEPEIEHTVSGQRALFDRSRADAYYLTMNTMYHVNWTDAPILSPAVSWLGLAGPSDPYRGFALTNAYTVAFFDRHLKGLTSALLDERSPDASEVSLERR